MSLDWKTPYCYMFRDPAWNSQIFIGGLWLLLLPPIGWPIALGYRKETLLALVEGRRPLLPRWNGHTWLFWREGLKAEAIILVYFLPFLGVFGFAAFDDWAAVFAHGRELVLFGVGVLLLLPVCLPLLPPLYWYLFDWIELSWAEQLAVGAVFWVTTFVMPAAFLQVSLTGRFLAALRIDRVLGFVGRNLLVYLEAWTISIIATAMVFALTLGAAWGIFWSYLVVVYTFNEALSRGTGPEVRRRFSNSCFVQPHSSRATVSPSWTV
jgi:hypothetical protein